MMSLVDFARAVEDAHTAPGTTFSLNFLAVDGHVKFLTPEKVSGGPNAVRAKGLQSRKFAETFAIK